MKTISVRDLQKKVKECVNVSQKDHVIITRNGKPAALLVGIEGKEWETVVLEASNSFWKLLKKRRGEKTIPASAFRKEVNKL